MRQSLKDDYLCQKVKVGNLGSHRGDELELDRLQPNLSPDDKKYSIEQK